MDLLVGKTYQLKKKLGSGAFGQIFYAINIKNNEQYAAKCQPTDTKNPLLLYQYKVLEYLNMGQNVDKGIPRCYFAGVEGNFNVMVMDLLGPSLQDIFSACNRKFDLKTTLMIGLQMIQRIQYVHSRQFIHRDIKPDNFLIGTDINKQTIYIIDFGLAKKYIQKDGTHIPYKDNKNLTGTARYASLNTHLGIEQSRRDDLEGIGNVLVYFLRGNLPWQNLKANSKKQKYEMIMEKKLGTPIEILCKDAPEQFKHFIMYSRNIQFQDQPNYQYLKNLFLRMMEDQKITADSKFCWKELQKKKKVDIGKNPPNI